MTRAISDALKAHYAQGTTTIAQCWRAQLRDGTVIAATTHSSDLLIDGVMYVTTQGYNPSNVENSSDLSVDNMEVDGFLAAPSITIEDIHSGRWDYAEILLFEVNYKDLTQGINILRAGTLGQVKAGRSIFTAELRGLTQKYSRRIVTLTTQECQADLGDARCKIDLQDWTVYGTVASVSNDKIITDPSRTEQAGFFTGGLLTFTGGLNAGMSMEVKSYIPGTIELFEGMPFRVTAADSDPLKQEPVVPDTYTMYAGCQKRFYQDCIGKFANGKNFRGFPHLPGVGVFGAFGTPMTPATVPGSQAHSPPPPPPPSGAPGPAPAPSGSMANKILACYFETYFDSDPFRITDVPLDFNVIYVFNAKFTADGSVTFVSATTNASNVQICRNRGQKCILTVGGSDSKFVFSNRTQSTNFLNSVQTIISALGGLDGVDFNNYEGQTQPPGEMVWIAQQLKLIYGSTFAITSPAGGNYSQDPTHPDCVLIKGLNDAGVLTWVNPQFYDWSGYKPSGYVTTRSEQWIGILGGDASKFVMGLSANYDGPPGSGPYENALTLAECTREYDATEAAYPNIRGAFCWNARTNTVVGGNVWGSTMRTHVDNALAAPPAPAPTPAPAPQPGGGTPSPFDVGANVHEGGSSTSENTTIVSLLSARGIRQVRIDLWTNPANPTLVHDFVSKCSAAGIKVQGLLMTRAQDDHTIYTGGALATWQSGNAADATSIINTYYPLGVRDFELVNEATYRSECQAQVTPDGVGNINESTYTGKTAFISIAAAAKGMADAVHAKGGGCRVILGTVGRDWGFLKYMATLGVTWDVTGFHSYVREGDAPLSTNTWFGPGGALGQLASFGKPVTINEFNAGEIYDPSYGNVAGDSLTEAGFRSIAKFGKELYNQAVCNLESVVFYELLDEPSKSGAESRFGLLYNLTTPKVALYLAAAFAGGTLSTAERDAITSRPGLLTSSEIDAMQPVSAPAPGPAPAPPPPATGGWGYYPAIPLVSPVPERWLQAGPLPVAYWAEDNPWGSAGLTRGTYAGETGTTYETAYGVKTSSYGPNGEVAARFAWKWPKGDLAAHEVKAYPSLVAGRKPGLYNSGPNPGGIPILLPDGTYSGTSPSGPTPGTFMAIPANGHMNPVNCSFAWQHNVAPSGQGHLSFDIWLQDRSNQTGGFSSPPITHEIMIPLDYWGGYGAYPNGRGQPYSHDMVIQGVLWHVYMARNFGSGWTFIVFEPDAPLSPAGRTLNLAEFLNHITTRTDASGQPWAYGNEWLSSIELGIEPSWGVGDLALTNFRVWQG